MRNFLKFCFSGSSGLQKCGLQKWADHFDRLPMLKRFDRSPMLKRLFDPRVDEPGMRCHLGYGAIAAPLLVCGLMLPAAAMRPTAQFGRDRSDFFEQGQFQMEREVRNLQQQQAQPTLSIDAAALDWQLVILREAGVAVSAPIGAIAQETVTLSLDSVGSSLAFDLTSSTVAGATFLVAVSDPLDRAAQATDPATLLADLGEAIARRSNATVRQAHLTQRDPRPVYTLQLSASPDTLDFQLQLAQGRVYVMGVKRSAALTGENLDRFFDSLQFLPASSGSRE